MNTEIQSFPGRNQDKVWEYFQTDGALIFEYAVPRLAYLFRCARRIANGRRVRVLNIRTGNGWLESRCQKEGWDTVGLDPNETAMEALQRNGINGAVAGIEAMPFADGTFDIVFSSEVLEHLHDGLLGRGLSEVTRILRPGGVFLGTVPYREPLELKTIVCMNCNHVQHAYGHHQSFSVSRLRTMFEAAGVQPLYFRTRGFPGFQRRDTVGKLKSVVWVMAGRLGAQAADAKIVFAARR
jgi:SAM-dependent methyltransferase